MIANYGLFWRKQRVQWVGPLPLAGRRLVGTEAKNKRAPEVNFRYQAGVYVLHDGFRVIYVGQTGANTGKLFGRLRAHTRDQLAERWDRFSWFGIHQPVETQGGGLHVVQYPQEKESYKRNVTLNHLEGVLIAVAEPPLNRAGARFGEGVVHYNQVDTRIAPVVEMDDGEEDLD
jgi:hypothetical protein